MKAISQSTFNEVASTVSVWTFGAVIAAASAVVFADISSLTIDDKSPADEMEVKTLASRGDVQTSSADGRYLKCWQRGRLIIDVAGWDYLPDKRRASDLTFGNDGKITKRLFVDGETTCLYSNEVRK